MELKTIEIGSDYDITFEIHKADGTVDPNAKINGNVALTVEQTFAADGSTAIDPANFATVTPAADGSDKDELAFTKDAANVGATGVLTAKANVTFTDPATGESVTKDVTDQIKGTLSDVPGSGDALAFVFNPHVAA